MCVYGYACRQATVVLREGTFVAGLVRLYVHGLLGRRETNAVGRSVGQSQRGVTEPAMVKRRVLVIFQAARAV